MSRTREVFGVLTDAVGTPLAGREVHVQTQPKVAGSAWQTVRVDRTDTRGMIRAAVRKFTSLRIRLIAPRDEGFAEGVSTDADDPRRRALVDQGRQTRHSGTVTCYVSRGASKAVTSRPCGMEIALYGFSPSKKRWLPVRTTVKVDPRGNWAAVYRFTATGVKATYKFRVRIAERATFPFATGYSRTVKVIVRP